MTGLQLPPLFKGEAVPGGTDPFQRAAAMAIAGVDSGTVVHTISGGSLKASLILSPEVPLEQAMIMLPVCGLGFQAALGALGPPEVAVHLHWAGPIRVNGAVCGRLRARASQRDPAALPDWLVIALELDLHGDATRPGQHPGRTFLSEEGCGGIPPGDLLESWVRHTLYWINRWEEDGPRPAHTEWRALAQELGEPIVIDGETGTFVGVDENFGMLLRTGDTTRLIPLSSRMEGQAP